MNKKIFKRGVALAMLLVLTVSAFIVPTSAKEVTNIFEAEKDSNGYYYSIYEYAEKYGDDVRFTVYFTEDPEVSDLHGYGCKFMFAVGDSTTQLDAYGDILSETYLYNCTVQEFESDFGNLIAQVFGVGNTELLKNRFQILGHYGHPNPVLYITAQVEAKDAQSGLIKTMFSGFGETIKGLTDGIKSMFVNILYVDGTASSGLSAFAKFGFLMGGLTMALGLGYVIVNKLR